MACSRQLGQRRYLSDMLQQIRELFERLVAELPPGTATVVLTPVPKGRGTVVEILPASPESVDFGVHCDESDIFSFSLGKVSGWEWPYERRYRYDEKDALAEVEEMSRAIIAGNCEEVRRWFCRSARIFVDGYTYKMTDLPKVPRPPFGTVHYAPYVGHGKLITKSLS
jgi:hypothetical protein